jgi:uncharacterized protein YxjI
VRIHFVTKPELVGRTVLEADKFMIKEQVKFFKNHHTYDIFDYDTQEQIGVAEEKISGFVKAMRWIISKTLMPTKIEVRDEDDALVFSIRRGIFFFRARVEVLNADGELIGYFQSKLFSFSGGFWVYDKKDKQFAEVKGNFIGFKYRILTPDGEELGKVTKEWGGAMKEIFTSADTYMVDVADDLTDQPVAKMLVLAAALSIDIIFKTQNRGFADI